MKRMITIAMALCVASALAQEDYEYVEPDMDTPIDSPVPAEDAHIEVDTPALNPIAPAQVDVVPDTVVAAASEIEVTVPDYVMVALVDQPQIVLDAIQQPPLLQQIDVPFYEMFRSGKMQWVAKQLKIAELSGDTERAAKLHKELVSMLRKWMTEEDITEPPHD